MLNQGQRLLFAYGAMFPHVMGLKNQSGYVGSRAKGQAGALLIWALRRIFGREHFIAWGFLAGVGVLEGCWIFKYRCDGAVAGRMAWPLRALWMQDTLKFTKFERSLSTVLTLSRTFQSLLCC